MIFLQIHTQICNLPLSSLACNTTKFGKKNFRFYTFSYEQLRKFENHGVLQTKILIIRKIQ